MTPHCPASCIDLPTGGLLQLPTEQDHRQDVHAALLHAMSGQRVQGALQQQVVLLASPPARGSIHARPGQQSSWSPSYSARTTRERDGCAMAMTNCRVPCGHRQDDIPSGSSQTPGGSKVSHWPPADNVRRRLAPRPLVRRRCLSTPPQHNQHNQVTAHLYLKAGLSCSRAAECASLASGNSQTHP